MRRSTLGFFCFALLLSCGFAQGDKGIPGSIKWDSVKGELRSYLTAHFLTPEQYVVEKFKDHDVVFIGEVHYIAQDPQLIQAVIPLLHENGVHALGLEFARRIDQPMIDSLLALPVYSETLAREIFLRGHVWWGYQEYVDILKAAWTANHAPASNGTRFRVWGLNNSPDWSYVKTPKDRDDPAIMKKVWHGEQETDWAIPILDSVVAKGQKILVYSGMHHAFTRYRQPKVFNGEFRGWGDVRAGNAVFEKIGNRAMTIFLHAPWVSAKGYGQPAVLAVDGYIDSLMAEMPQQFRRVGFDVAGTPFAGLPGETSIYKFGYEDFSLSTFCDGYIYQGGLATYQPVAVIRDFVNSSNIAYARGQAGDIDAQNAGPEYFYNGMVEAADVKARYAHLRR